MSRESSYNQTHVVFLDLENSEYDLIIITSTILFSKLNLSFSEAGVARRKLKDRCSLASLGNRFGKQRITINTRNSGYLWKVAAVYGNFVGVWLFSRASPIRDGSSRIFVGQKPKSNCSIEFWGRRDKKKRWGGQKGRRGGGRKVEKRRWLKPIETIGDQCSVILLGNGGGLETKSS